MEPNTTKIDENGKKVLSFGRKIHNLGRIGDLTKTVVEIAESGIWRSYTTGLGREQWRAAEFDYFLIAQDVRHEDARSMIAWNDKGAALAPLMDPNANSRQRRPIEQAAESWHAPGPESFIGRAKRLEWVKNNGEVKPPPVSNRAQYLLRTGMKREDYERKTRTERIALDRRQELDRLAKKLEAKLESIDERRYMIDKLRHSQSPTEIPTVWRADAEQFDWKASALAEHWNVSRMQASRRLQKLRSSRAGQNETKHKGGDEDGR